MKIFKFVRKVVLFLIAFKMQSIYASDFYLNTVADNFSKISSSTLKLENGTWQFISILDCFTSGQSCFGNNPSTPYSGPYFKSNLDSNELSNELRFNSSEAIVILFRTPPKMRYFGITQYLVRKGGSTTSMPVFGSLSDSLSMNRIFTHGSTKAGENVFNQYSAVVWVNDSNLYSHIRKNLISSGFNSSSINLMSIPSSLPKSSGNPKYDLKFGISSQSDSFGMLLRLALPDNQIELDNYIKENPFVVFKTSFKQSKTIAKYTVIPYKSEISNKIEDQNLNNSLENLVSDIKANYSSLYSLSKQKTSYLNRTGWSCIQNDIGCQGDTHDALYSLDVQNAIQFQNSDSDFVIVVGVNHQKTGKATYLNHSVYDISKFAGITAVADTKLTSESALYHIGNLVNSDKIEKYKNLYAYMVSYNCNGRSFCLEIPPPTEENPIGLIKGSPFLLMGRKYVDPITKVRPSPNEIIMHQVFIGTKK